MTTYGIQTSGFVAKSRATILSELEASAKAAFGDSNLDVSEDSFVGLLLGVIADNLALNWETAQGVYAQAFPDGATGVSLERACSFTGISRKAAYGSQVDVRVLGDPALRIINLPVHVGCTLVPGEHFVSDSGASATVVSVHAGYLTITGVLGTFQEDEGLTGTTHSGSAGGPQYFDVSSSVLIPKGTTFDSGVGSTQVVTMADNYMTIIDGSLVGAYLRCEATTTGPIAFNALCITRLTSVVSAIFSFSNPLSQAVLGANIESDDELRARRESSLQIIGGSSLDAIRSRVLDVSHVTEAYCYINDDNVLDTYGQPAHSFQIVVRGGADLDIATAIMKTKPVGIYCHGTSSINLIDATGVSRTIRWTRPSPVPIYVTVNVETYGQQISDAALVAAVRDTITGLETSYKIGNDVVASKMVKAIFDTDPTIQNVSSVLIGLAASPSTSSTISIGPIGYAAFDASRIVVNIVHLGSV